MNGQKQWTAVSGFIPGRTDNRSSGKSVGMLKLIIPAKAQPTSI
jgi:hypothetical protein